MREWKEIGNIFITESGPNILMRFTVFSKDGIRFKGADVLLRPEEMADIYKLLQNILRRGLENKECAYCKHYRYLSCSHPDKEVRGYVCNKEGHKYFEPRLQL
jgi:hypothetical protein